jgi:mRNA interferase RelE/StbE
VSSYQIKFKSSAVKELKNSPSQIQKRISIKIEELRQNPRPSGVVKLTGDDKLYRVRVGNYRIVFSIDDTERIIRITRIRHRRDVYDK